MANKRILYDQDGVKVGVLKDWRLNPLTTAERTALGLTLGVNNSGLSVFDISETKQYFWSGTEWVTVGGGDYVLPKATTVLLGGIIVGDNLTVDSNGRLSATTGAVLINDLTAKLGTNNTLGGIADGDTYLAGTLIETVLVDLLTVAVHPIYIAPTVTLTGFNNQDVEIGVTISPSLTINFTANDSGGAIAQRLYRNSTVLSTATNYTDANYTVPLGLTEYSAQVDYAQGAVKNNNLGDPDPSGRILAGTITSNSILVHGYKNAFYQAITSAVPTTSAGVRALTGKLLNPAGKDFIIDIPVGTVNVVFAIPAELTLQYVQYIELSNSDIQMAFTQQVVSVEGANGYTPSNYKVYSFTPVEPFPVEVHYRVKAQ